MSVQMMICGNADKCHPDCFHSKKHLYDKNLCSGECNLKSGVKGSVCIPYEEKKPAQPAKKRVRAYKEDWITRAVTAEVKVHQLQVKNNKLREALAAIVGGAK